VLSQEAPAATITDQLVELTGAKGYALPLLAADELKKRQLSERQLQRLTMIAHEIPFNSLLGCIQVPGHTEYEDRTGEPAWTVVAHAMTTGRLTVEQVAWLVGELRFSDRYAASPADSATHMLEKIGEPAVNALIAEMRRKDPKSQHMAARTLAKIASPVARQALEEWSLDGVANSTDPLVWPYAAMWLAQLQSGRAFPVIEQSLWKHIEEHGTYALVLALTRLDAQRAKKTLSRVVTEYKPDDRQGKCVEAYVQSAVALTKLQDAGGFEALQSAVTSPLAELRMSIAQMMFVLGEQGRSILQQLADDRDAKVAQVARLQLQELDRRKATTTP
jgi:hypothetical protein